MCHYFDLIAGTSTGAIIAATLAIGWTVEEIRSKYMTLGEVVFTRSLLRQGVLRAKYDEAKLIAELKKVYGAKTTLAGPDLKTGLLVMTKRIDTGSPWPISNNPSGKYFAPARTASWATATIHCGKSCEHRQRRRRSSILSPSRSLASRMQNP